MEKSWKPTTSGVLCIIIGGIGCLGGLALSISANQLGLMYGMRVVGVILASAIPAIILSILALAGGVYALRRKTWGLALAGSISCLLLNLIFGIPAIIFILMSRNEFE